MVCLLVVVTDASRLTQEPAKIKGVLEVILKNGAQPGEAAIVGGANHEIGGPPCPPGSRFPQAVCLTALGLPCGESHSPAGWEGLSHTLVTPPQWRQKGPDSVKLGSQVQGGFLYSSVRSA